MSDVLLGLPLTSDESSRLYWELSRRGAYCTGERRPWGLESVSEEELLALAVAQSRYDPRLAAVLTDFFRSPRSMDPVRFKQGLRRYDTLAAAAVIGEYVLESRPPDEVCDLFEFLRAGVSPVPTQLFYKGLYPVAGHKVEETLTRPLWAFKKWGFLAADPPLLKDRPFEGVYLYDRDARIQILRELADSGPFRMRDYLEKLRHSISRQQALKDVRSFPGIRKRGRCKGARYEAYQPSVGAGRSTLFSKFT